MIHLPLLVSAGHKVRSDPETVSEISGTKEQLVKKHICESYGFQYIILKRNKDAKKMAEQIIELLRKKHIYIVTDIDEDLKRVQSRHRLLRYAPFCDQ